MSLRRIVSCFTPGLVTLSLAFLLGGGPTAAWSQATSTGTVSGLVSDEQSAAIPGAEIKLVDSATGAAQTTLSNETGRFVVVNVQPGTYSITVSKQGFTVFKISAQRVELGASLSISP